MVTFEYDPQATYPNVGERGNSSLQATRMTLEKIAEMTDRYALGMRYQVVVSLPRAQLEMLMAVDPQAFDDVKPV
jgi:hypothetical protein